MTLEATGTYDDYGLITSLDIDALIQYKNPVTTMPMISETDSNPAYPKTRNPYNWGSFLDFSCVCLWNSENGITKAGVLISPQHVIFAEHWKPSVGSTLVFLSMNNQRVLRTLTKMTTAPGFVSYYPDYAIGFLDSPVPGYIGKAYFLADGSRFPTETVNNVPVVWKNQFNELCVAELWRLTAKFAFYAKPLTGQRALFGKTVILYDSGSPNFLVIDNKLVLMSVMTGGGGGQGTNLIPHTQDINNIMASQGGGYTISTIV